MTDDLKIYELEQLKRVKEELLTEDMCSMICSPLEVEAMRGLIGKGYITATRGRMSVESRSTAFNRVRLSSRGRQALQ